MSVPLKVNIRTIRFFSLSQQWVSIKRNNLYVPMFEGRILLRESSQGEGSGLRVRLEGSLKPHYDAYSLPVNAYSLPANAYSLH